MIDPSCLERTPSDPGVYLFKDRRGKVLYVGKARNLKARLRQYLSGADERVMVPFLVQSAETVDFVLTRTEKEALILENTLIKKHRPRYNVKLVDDANFLHLRIDPRGYWPRYQVVRSIGEGRARHFGPYASASRARATLEFLQRRFPLRTCSDRELKSRSRPCLLYQMGRCLAPCAQLCRREQYDEVLQQSVLFLEGRNTELVDRLRARMDEAAEAERYEEAGRHRDLIRAIEASIERQLVVDSRGGSRDLWGLYRSGDKGLAALLPVRAGRMEEAIELPFDGVVGEDGELLSSLINAWYTEADEIPAEVVLPLPPPDLEALGAVLAERRGAAVHLRVPQRGEKLRMVEVAQENARSAYTRRESEEERKERALEELRRVCQLQRMPRRIECFDNSNIQGTDPVASMVVYVDGRPARPLWRRYRVKTVVGADDFASMREILGRRIRRGLEEGDLPDLIVVDGGKGQVSAAAAIFEELGLIDQRRASTQGSGQRPVVGLCGLAKPRTEHARGDREATDKIVLPGVMNPLRLHANSPALHLLQAIRDDTHDAAVRYHRQVRDRRNLTSALDELPGIGPARRKALLQHLGSLSAVMEASEEQLAAVPGIGAALAASIHQALRRGDEGGEE